MFYADDRSRLHWILYFCDAATTRPEDLASVVLLSISAFQNLCRGKSPQSMLIEQGFSETDSVLLRLIWTQGIATVAA